MIKTVNNSIKLINKKRYFLLYHWRVLFFFLFWKISCSQVVVICIWV